MSQSPSWTWLLCCIALVVLTGIQCNILPATAECDKNNTCPGGELCYRKYCRPSCSTAEASREEQLIDCNVISQELEVPDDATSDEVEAAEMSRTETINTSDILCRECEGECAGDDGQVCVNGTICEPVCECEDCCVNGTCVDP